MKRIWMTGLYVMCRKIKIQRKNDKKDQREKYRNTKTVNGEKKAGIGWDKGKGKLVRERERHSQKM